MIINTTIKGIKEVSKKNMKTSRTIQLIADSIVQYCLRHNFSSETRPLAEVPLEIKDRLAWSIVTSLSEAEVLRVGMYPGSAMYDYDDADEFDDSLEDYIAEVIRETIANYESMTKFKLPLGLNGYQELVEQIRDHLNSASLLKSEICYDSKDEDEDYEDDTDNGAVGGNVAADNVDVK